MGVFLNGCAKATSNSSLPHARGGVSGAGRVYIFKSKSSPRPWGCFWEDVHFWDLTPVFPTPVGVFLRIECCFSRSNGLPHARGGVSSCELVSVFLKKSSPRPWGCFSRDNLKAASSGVFPTPVGVFLGLYETKEQCIGLPHARGGVSARLYG